MHAGDDFTDAGLDATLVSDVSDVFAAFADNDSSFLGGDKCAKCQSVIWSRRTRSRTGRRTWEKKVRRGVRRIGDKIHALMGVLTRRG